MANYQFSAYVILNYKQLDLIVTNLLFAIFIAINRSGV